MPHELVGQVLEICLMIGEREEAILADVLAGSSLTDARARHGYHLLQRKEEMA